MDIFFTKHAIQRMFEREIDEQEIIDTVEKGRIIAEYSDDKPFPSFLAYSENPGNPLHVVFSRENERHIVITIYRPTREEWNDDYSIKRSNV